MKTVFSWILVLVYYACPSGETTGDVSGTRRYRNKRSIRQRAFNRACRTHTCVNLKCNNEDGWSLYGSDWGCCGNYDGCCTWATSVCYYHDAMCKCCDYGWLICGPDCKPEAECFEGYEENSNQIYEHNTDSRSEKDTNDTWMNNKFETKKNILSEIIHAKKMKNSVLPPKGDKNETIENGKSFPNGKSKNASIKLKYTKYRKNRLTKKLYARDQLMLADQSFKDYVEDGSGETL